MARIAVSAAYAAQGYGYASLMTTLPAFKDRYGFDATDVSLVVLGVCATAALGSVASGRVAQRRGSHAALALGLFAQCAGMLLAALGPPVGAYAAAIGLYGAGLGAVDASSGMQGVLVQRRLGRSIMSALFAAYTAAAIGAALLVSALAASRTGAQAAVAVAGVVAGSVAAVGSRLFARGGDEAGAAPPPSGARRTAAPSSPGGALSARAAIWIFGTAILVAFVADAAVSTWSTEYLRHTLLASATAAPLGYAAYQAVILATRLGGDPAVRRWGRVRLVRAGSGVSIAGLILVALVPATPAAVAGFAVVGVGVGILVPLTFSAAGEVDPARSDHIISTMNTFNYLGSVIGGAAIGPLADAGIGMSRAFLLPAVCLVAFLLIARFYAGAAGRSRPRAASGAGIARG